MLGAQVDKLKRLCELPGERVIIVGGSGCGEGFVTSNLCAALNRPVYNMGLHAGLGLIYQMKAVEPLVRAGDTVLLIPEYANFDGQSCFGDMELLMMVLDIMPRHKALLSKEHWMRLLPVMPKYGADKLRHLFMPSRKKSVSGYFDEYGDGVYPSTYAPTAQLPFPPVSKLSADAFSPVVIGYIKDFEKSVQAKGGEVLIFPPAFQLSSYERQGSYITCIEAELKSAGVPFATSTKRYAADDIYFFDTPYHLNAIGRIFRSALLIDDLLVNIRQGGNGK